LNDSEQNWTCDLYIAGGCRIIMKYTSKGEPWLQKYRTGKIACEYDGIGY